MEAEERLRWRAGVHPNVLDSTALSCASSWRAMKHAVMLTEYMRTMYSQPDIEKARKHADAFLPKDRHGKLYPLSSPLKSFHNLGAGVALYMYMVHWWSLFFFAAYLSAAAAAAAAASPPVAPACRAGALCLFPRDPNPNPNLGPNPDPDPNLDPNPNPNP